MALAGPPRSHEKWSRRLKLTSALLGATRARFPSVTREPQAPRTVALEHEHQTLDRRGSSRRRPYFHIRLGLSPKSNFRFTEFSEVAWSPAKRSFQNPPRKSPFKANRLPRHAEPRLRYDALCGEVLAAKHGR